MARVILKAFELSVSGTKTLTTDDVFSKYKVLLKLFPKPQKNTWDKWIVIKTHEVNGTSGKRKVDEISYIQANLGNEIVLIFALEKIYL